MLNTPYPVNIFYRKSTFELMLYIKKILTAVLLLLVAITSVNSQPQKVVADKINGIVGDKIILQSDIKNSLADIARNGGTLPDNAECLLMDQAIVSKVLMLQAAKDSLPLTDEEVEAELDQKIRYYINQLGSQEALEQMAGKTIYQIKDDARESVKEQKMAAAMQRKIVDGVRITPNEVKTFFDRIPNLEDYIVSEMNNYKKQLESKAADFCRLAKQVSEDPGSKERCGQYQINRNEKTWDPAFMSAAFRLKDGEISTPIKSKFGYHIIQMVQRSGDDAIIRHILRIPPVTNTEITQAISKLDTVRSKIIAGTIGFNAAALKYSEDESAKFSGPFITGRDGSTYITIDQLDKDMVLLLGKIKVGEFSQPTAFTDEQGKKGVRIVYLKSRSEPHRMNMHDDYSKISQMAIDEKKQITMDKWLKEKIPTYYIMVDPGTSANCPQLQKYAIEKKSF